MSDAIKVDYENLFKRLLMLNQHGVYLIGRDGHTWIEQDGEIEYPLKLDTVMVNSKIYGGVIQAIEVMDEAIKMDGQDGLFEQWKDYGCEVMRIGRGGVDPSRIDKVEKGKGGIH